MKELITSIGILIFIMPYCICPLIAQGARNALSFDGNDDYVDLTVGDYVTDSEGAFEVWIKPVCAGEDELKVLSLVHDRQPNVPVLVMTGYKHTELGQKAKQVFKSDCLRSRLKRGC